MNSEQLERLKNWFTGFVAGFYTCGSDAFLDSHVRLKEEHTDRVCGEMRLLTDGLGLSEEDANLAQAAAVLHDAGRFPQIRKYRTYVDPKSVNHCLLGVQVLAEEHVLEGLDPADRAILETTVRWHGAKALPQGLEERSALFCRLIRDADKLDVLPLLIGNFTQYYADPENFPLEVEFPDKPQISGHILEALIGGKLIGYEQIETLHDAQLVLMGWVYDINFIPALKRILERRYLEQIAAFLPDRPEVRQAVDHIFGYVRQRIGGNI